MVLNWRRWLAAMLAVVLVLHLGGVAGARPMQGLGMDMAQTSMAQTSMAGVAMGGMQMAPAASPRPARRPTGLCPCCVALAHLALPQRIEAPRSLRVVPYRHHAILLRLTPFPAAAPAFPPPRSLPV